MEALEAIMTRRSTRRYSEKTPEHSLIERVIEAGRHAPSGGNNQTTHFIVFTDKTVLGNMAKLVCQEFSKMDTDENTYASLRHSVSAAKKGGYVFHYGAPVFIVVANRKGYGNALADSACALENMMIAANALDLGSCWINQLHWLDENAEIRSFMAGYGLRDDETITGGLILGYPEGGLPDRVALERKGNPVTWADSRVMELFKGRPENAGERLPREIRTYDYLDALKIEYERTDHERADNMEACNVIDAVLGVVICKNLFLCNRQKTKFYLLMMPGDKKFKTKELSSQINSARLSFAEPEDMLKYLDIEPGAVSIMGLMNDKEHAVQLLIDEDVLKDEYLGCHPCVCTSSLKLRTRDVIEKFLPSTGHDYQTVHLVGED